ncbi:CBS domain-containing protein [Paenibacillus sp. YIM B09110]|uniref:CBS domain-containing protein n=1 Tax=Paenibacillus sp. YIM B09110 TaxID=3126102 RepID=UPI00301E0D5C
MSNHTVEQLMSTNCVTATLLDNVYELAVKMKQHDIGFIPIVNGNKLVGVVTDRDLVVRGYAEKNPGSEAVETVMTLSPITIEPPSSADDAAALMAEHQIRRLPVVQEGMLVGVIAIGDLAVRDIYANEAEAALSAISEHSHSGHLH